MKKLMFALFAAGALACTEAKAAHIPVAAATSTTSQMSSALVDENLLAQCGYRRRPAYRRGYYPPVYDRSFRYRSMYRPYGYPSGLYGRYPGFYGRGGSGFGLYLRF